MKRRLLKKSLYARWFAMHKDLTLNTGRLQKFSDPLQFGNEIWGKVLPVGREFGSELFTENHKNKTVYEPSNRGLP